MRVLIERILAGLIMVYEYILDCVSCWITFQSAVCLQITMLLQRG